MLGRQDSNLRMRRSKPRALPLGDVPIKIDEEDRFYINSWKKTSLTSFPPRPSAIKPPF